MEAFNAQKIEFELKCAKLKASFDKEQSEKLNFIQQLIEIITVKNQKHEVSYKIRNLLGLKKEEETGKANTALENVMKLVLELRDKAKTNKDFATSDDIRNKLTTANIQVKDGKDCATWSI